MPSAGDTAGGIIVVSTALVRLRSRVHEGDSGRCVALFDRSKLPSRSSDQIRDSWVTDELIGSST
jgi:hypothetical protein